MIYEYEFWNDEDLSVGKALYINDEMVLITEIDGRKTSIIKKDGEIFYDLQRYLQSHVYSYIPSYVIYDIRHMESSIQSMLER